MPRGDMNLDQLEKGQKFRSTLSDTNESEMMSFSEAFEQSPRQFQDYVRHFFKHLAVRSNVIFR